MVKDSDSFTLKKNIESSETFPSDSLKIKNQEKTQDSPDHQETEIQHGLKTHSNSEVKSLAWAVKDLFGEPVILMPGMQPEVEYFLALVAEAWDLRGRIRKPARTIFGKIKKGEAARCRYRADPMRWLPDWFQEEISALRRPNIPHSDRGILCIGIESNTNGVVTSAVKGAPGAILGCEKELLIGCEVDDISEPEAGSMPPETVLDPSLLLPIGPGREQSAWQAWEWVMAEMRREININLYNQCLDAAGAVTYDAESGRLVVQVENEYARQLFESRLRRTIERGLYALADRLIQLDLRVKPSP